MTATWYDYPQGSIEWHRIRLGRPSASNFHRIITAKDAKPSTQARKYQCELVHERIFQRTWEKFGAGRPIPLPMVEGAESEQWAAKQFALETGCELQTIGHILDASGRYGCSPDRLIKDRNEAVEIKCPTGPVHIGYLLDGPEMDYRPQIQGQFLIGGFSKIYFYSYHQEMSSYLLTIAPDPEFIGKLHRLLVGFCDELDRAEKYVRELGVWPKDLPSVFPKAEESE